MCLDCGLEKNQTLSIIRDTSPRDMSPFPTGYSKSKRFAKILDGLLYPTPSPADAKMIEFLTSRVFDTLPEMLSAMKSGTFRDKRYISIHLFAKLFLRGYKPPKLQDRPFHSSPGPKVLSPARRVGPLLPIRKRILMEFEHIQFGHMRYTPETQFFNYSWLLVVLLGEFGLGEYVPYIKNLRCNHRKTFYRELLASIRHAYNEIGPLVGALGIRIQPAVQLDGPPKPRPPSQSLSKNCEILLRQYRLGHTGGARSDFAV